MISKTSCNINPPIFKNPLEKPKTNRSSRTLKKNSKSTWQSLNHPLMKTDFTQKYPNLKFSPKGKVSLIFLLTSSIIP
jgi:hypothetical protein